ncbi:hypothetical protein [Mesobacillus maritimus]|uniref:hypothetical protein n=1 Tax=Mesobacillus maritimus TaxID=1643336 RepID=UPI00384DB08E
MRNIIAFLFKACLVVFLLGGTCLVFGQMAGLIFGNGDLIIYTWDIFAYPTFIFSAIAGVLGFILGYLPKDKSTEVDMYSLEEFREAQ